MTSDYSHGRGILTERDREYLLGEHSYDEEQQERNRRTYIRNRISNAILDFHILVHHLNERDRKLVFKELAKKEIPYVNSPSGARFRLDSEGGFTEDPELDLEWGMINAIAFFYLVCQDCDIPFNKVVEEGIRQVEEDRLVAMEIVDPEDPLENVAKKFLTDEPLSELEEKLIRRRLQENRPDFEIGSNKEMDEGYD